MKLRAGELRHQITIQRYTSTQNDYGEMEESWNDLFTIRAKVNPFSGKEVFQSDTVIAKLSHRVFMRYKEDVKPQDRVVFNGRLFDIESVINHEEKNISLELLCLEKY